MDCSVLEAAHKSEGVVFSFYECSVVFSEFHILIHPYMQDEAAQQRPGAEGVAALQALLQVFITRAQKSVRDSTTSGDVTGTYLPFLSHCTLTLYSGFFYVCCQLFTVESDAFSVLSWTCVGLVQRVAASLERNSHVV